MNYVVGLVGILLSIRAVEGFDPRLVNGYVVILALLMILRYSAEVGIFLDYVFGGVNPPPDQE